MREEIERCSTPVCTLMNVGVDLPEAPGKLSLAKARQRGAPNTCKVRSMTWRTLPLRQIQGPDGRNRRFPPGPGEPALLHRKTLLEPGSGKSSTSCARSASTSFPASDTGHNERRLGRFTGITPSSTLYGEGLL